MRDVVQNAPTWTVGAGISGMFSAVNDLSLLGLLSAIGICIGIFATIHKVYLDIKVAKAQMERLKQDDK